MLASTLAGMDALLDLDLLIKQIALALGAAMVIGNGYAIIQHMRGKAPKGESGEFRPGRAYWLLAVGLVIAIWGAVSLLS
jgi:hypothetical protein